MPRPTLRRRDWFSPRVQSALGLALPLTLAILVRLVAPVRDGFPLMDGGLFYSMIQDIQRNGFALPLFASYNGGAVPFAYPPAGLYLAALAQTITSATLLDILRWLPAILSTLSVFPFYWLGGSLLGNRRAVILSTICFALMPESFRWSIMGGGVTRALGMLAALTALCFWRAYLLHGGPGRLFLTAFALSLALASHPEMALFTLTGLVVLASLKKIDASTVLKVIVASAAATAICSPWWVTVVGRHGLSPFLGAGGHGFPLFAGIARSLLQGATGEPFVPVFLGLATFGALVSVRQRVHYLGLWTLLILMADNWLPETTAVVPLALLAGTALDFMLVDAGSPGTANGAPAGGADPRPLSSRLIRGAAIGVMVYGTIAALVVSMMTIRSLPGGERQAMAWVANNTPVESHILVVPPERWGLDASSEWFPALTGRRSVATVQGTEWLPGGEFSRRVAWNRELQRCPSIGAECIESWVSANAQPVDYVYVPKRAPFPEPGTSWSSSRNDEDCCRLLRRQLSVDSRYALVYDGDGAAIFSRAR